MSRRRFIRISLRARRLWFEAHYRPVPPGTTSIPTVRIELLLITMCAPADGLDMVFKDTSAAQHVAIGHFEIEEKTSLPIRTAHRGETCTLEGRFDLGTYLITIPADPRADSHADIFRLAPVKPLHGVYGLSRDALNGPTPPGMYSPYYPLYRVVIEQWETIGCGNHQEQRRVIGDNAIRLELKPTRSPLDHLGTMNLMEGTDLMERDTERSQQPLPIDLDDLWIITSTEAQIESGEGCPTLPTGTSGKPMNDT